MPPSKPRQRTTRQFTRCSIRYQPDIRASPDRHETILDVSDSSSDASFAEESSREFRSKGRYIRENPI